MPAFGSSRNCRDAEGAASRAKRGALGLVLSSQMTAAIHTNTDISGTATIPRGITSAGVTEPFETPLAASPSEHAIAHAPRRLRAQLPNLFPMRRSVSMQHAGSIARFVDVRSDSADQHPRSQANRESGAL